MVETDLARRSILKCILAIALATGSALPVMAQPDPIFAAIERHRSTFKAYIEASAAEDDGKISRAELRTVIAVQDEARDALTSTAPTTIAGLLAVIAWLAEYDEGCMPDTCGAWLEAFAKSEAFANLKAQGGLYA